MEIKDKKYLLKISIPNMMNCLLKQSEEEMHHPQNNFLTKCKNVWGCLTIVSYFLSKINIRKSYAIISF